MLKPLTFEMDPFLIYLSSESLEQSCVVLVKSLVSLKIAANTSESDKAANNIT